MLEVLAEHGPAFAEKEREHAAREVEAAHKAALEVAAHLAKRRGHLVLANYLTEPTRPKHGAPELAPPGQLRKRNDSLVEVAEALDLVIGRPTPTVHLRLRAISGPGPGRRASRNR